MLAQLILADAEAFAAGYLALLLGSCVGATAALVGVIMWTRRSPDERSRSLGVGLLVLLVACVLFALRLLNGPSFFRLW